MTRDDDDDAEAAEDDYLRGLAWMGLEDWRPAPRPRPIQDVQLMEKGLL